MLGGGQDVEHLELSFPSESINLDSLFGKFFDTTLYSFNFKYFTTNTYVYV